MIRVLAIGVVLALAGGGAWVWLAGSQGAAGPAVQPETVDIARGAALYAESCAICHGASLEGQEDWRSPGEDGVMPAPPHSEEGHTWHHGDGLLFEYTKIGGKAALGLRGIDDFNSGMPAFGDLLTEAEIWDILAYIKSTWRPRIQEMQAARSDAERMEGN